MNAAQTDHPKHLADKWIDGTGDIVTGDHIKFTEAVFGGSYKSPKYSGDRTIEAIVTKDSYGQDKQQHTFTMVVVSSAGEEALKPGDTIRRKGRNVYKNGTERLLWKDETQRNAAADEKHSRGDQARAARDQRRNERLK